jgi:hypothetical protein
MSRFAVMHGYSDSYLTCYLYIRQFGCVGKCRLALFFRPMLLLSPTVTVDLHDKLNLIVLKRCYYKHDFYSGHCPSWFFQTVFQKLDLSLSSGIKLGQWFEASSFRGTQQSRNHSSLPFFIPEVWNIQFLNYYYSSCTRIWVHWPVPRQLIKSACHVCQF